MRSSKVALRFDNMEASSDPCTVGVKAKLGWVEVEATLHRNPAVKGREKMVRKPEGVCIG